MAGLCGDVDELDGPSFLNEDTLQCEKFLAEIDPGLKKFSEEFLQVSVTSKSTLKYLRPRKVYEMKLPDVYKRMVIDKIISLQTTPDSKAKIKLDIQVSPVSVNKPFSSLSADSDRPVHQPKKLKFDDCASTLDRSTTANETVGENVKKSDGFLITSLEKLRDEKDTLTILLSHKTEELKDLKRGPDLPLSPLALTGNAITKFSCDRCHHTGHRSHANRGNKSCNFPKCQGFQVCGLEKKHPEHKQALNEIQKEINGIEKRLRVINDEIDNISTFARQNDTNFIAAMRPKLKFLFPSKHVGQKGMQILQRDLRLLKLATKSKIPADVSKEAIEAMLTEGKTCVLKFDCKVEDVNNNPVRDSTSVSKDDSVVLGKQCTPDPPACTSASNWLPQMAQHAHPQYPGMQMWPYSFSTSQMYAPYYRPAVPSYAWGSPQMHARHQPPFACTSASSYNTPDQLTQQGQTTQMTKPFQTYAAYDNHTLQSPQPTPECFSPLQQMARPIQDFSPFDIHTMLSPQPQPALQEVFPPLPPENPPDISVKPPLPPEDDE